jgi:excisionase family DNA binding protein
MTIWASSTEWDADRLLTTADVAARLGLSTEAVLRRWRAGELPGFRLSTKVLRFRESELNTWLESRRQGPRQQAPGPPALATSERDAG